MTDRQANVESSGSPAVLREILRTPAFRELIRIQLDGADGATGRQLVRNLVEEDVQLPLELAACSPGALNATISAALELGRHLSGLPEPLLQAYIEGILAELDADAARQLPLAWGPLLVRSLPFATAVLTEATERLARSLEELDPARRAELVAELVAGLDAARAGAALNALSVLVLRMHEDASDALGDRAVVGKILDAIDFGKLRKASAAVSGLGREVGLAALEHGLDDPVVLANTVIAITPLINDLLSLAAGLADGLDLPDEILAAAALRLVGDLDGKALGRIASGVATAINGIHAGSLTLGATEPAIRVTAAELLDQVLDNVDGVALARAAVALGEDGETLATVLADWIRRDPTVLRAWAATSAQAGAPVVRGVISVLREINALDDATLAVTVGAFASSVEPREVARLVDELAGLARRVQVQHPDAPLLSEVLAELDLRRLGAVAATLTGQLAGSSAAHPQLREALAPPAVARRINGALRRFNRYMARGRDENAVLQVVAEVDAAELEQAWRNLLGLLSGTLLSSADLALAVVRPAVGVGVESARLVATSARDIRSKRREGRRRFPWMRSNR